MVVELSVDDLFLFVSFVCSLHAWKLFRAKRVRERERKRQGQKQTDRQTETETGREVEWKPLFQGFSVRR